MYAEVVLSKATPRLDKIYHYRIPKSLAGKIQVGHQVLIPFGKRKTLGYVVGLLKTSDIPGIKDIEEIISEKTLFGAAALKLAKWISNYYLCFFVSALRTVMPPGTRQREKRKRVAKPVSGFEARGSAEQPTTNIETGIGPKLTSYQIQALELIEQSHKQTILLHGITGSGKTEIYLQAIARALGKKLGSIVLVPEISLTPQLTRRFKDRFKDHIAVLHSDLTIKQRDLEWARLQSGEARIVLGTRSAVFAPVENLGLVVLDEEYEQTYKQEKSPRYHAREVAQQLGATVILGSATPSIETFYKAQNGEYRLATLPERIDRVPLPPVEIIDLREEKDRLLSRKLRKEISETLSRGEKVILFMNRRGYFTSAICKNCGYVLKCPNCQVALVYHSQDKLMCCGHCDFTSEANLICPNCQNSAIGFLGIGTQRIESEVAEVYPQARIVRLDRDALTKRGSAEQIFAAFSEGEANVLIGTQLVTKGLDVAEVTLVGVVSADTTLNLPDFRAAERTFQQLTQVAGRAGRRHLPGKVIIQTYNPEHYAIRHAATHNYEGFYKEELEYRQALFYPPFSQLINLVVLSRQESEAQTMAKGIAESLKNLQVLGPAPAPLSKLRGQFRYQILLKGEKIEPLQQAVKESLKKLEPAKSVRIQVDVDPLNLL
jgi:primosomal protein N' (replication factor Y)